MKTSAFVLVAIGLLVCLVWYKMTNNNTTDCKGRGWPGGESGELYLKEDFVPHNSYAVGNDVSSLVEMDTLAINAAFNEIMKDDAGMFRVSELPQFRQAVATREQSREYIQAVIDRINRKANRRYAILDIQSIGKETTFDPSDNNNIIERYVVNLFVQEHDSRQVHASANNISMTFIVKPATQAMQITDLHFITDYYYNGPLVGGANPYDKFFRILNPFHLQQPFRTSDDKVLHTDGEMLAILKDHHNDAKTPRYRCFGDGSSNKTLDAKTQRECQNNGGNWDKPVVADEECPFFGANKNYVNRHGGVTPDGQFCELPVGMKRVGYRYASDDPANKPWCYSCRIGADGAPNSAGPCCDEQRNKSLYPGLVSPDYMFPGDALERGQQWRELGDRGIHWRAQATTIRDTTDRNQKQPVFNAVVGPK